ncbi:MAG: tripartite tricarboxylate transporter substrate-binding protein, partial [Firmicutes bacterium]|nr:tripartite tricarboxylate transporter substrate-binding protein [Bacillota bacterium]
TKSYGGQYKFVPFDSGAQAVTALLGKHVEAAIVSLSGQAVTPDKVRLLATTLDQRTPAFPDAPTFAELNHPELSLSFHVGALAPPGTPPEVVNKLEEAFKKAFEDPGFQEWANKGSKPIGAFWGQKKWTEFLKEYEGTLVEMMPLLEEAAKAQ